MAKAFKPKVGRGVTMPSGSDSYPGTIIAVSKSGRKITVQEDTATRLDDRGPYTENQEYKYEPNLTGPVTEFSLRSNGRWVRVGEPNRHGSSSCWIGHRRYYRDPCY